MGFAEISIHHGFDILSLVIDLDFQAEPVVGACDDLNLSALDGDQLDGSRFFSPRFTDGVISRRDDLRILDGDLFIIARTLRLDCIDATKNTRQKDEHDTDLQTLFH
jgi:hypothetical protein